MPTRIEVRGVNYILPTDIPPVKQGQEGLLTGEAVQTEKIISDLQDRGARASVFVLDACRDNPFKTGSTRSVGGVRGLAQGTPPEGVFVLYSAGVGQSALDRMSDNDPIRIRCSRGCSSRRFRKRTTRWSRLRNLPRSRCGLVANRQPHPGAGLL